MSNVSINDLNPRESEFTFRGKQYTLKKFSLAVQVWAHDEFATDKDPNGLTNLSASLLNLDAGAISKTCYFLLKDKTDFPTEEHFIDALEDNHTAIKVLLKPFSRCLGISQPTDDEADVEAELKK